MTSKHKEMAEWYQCAQEEILDSMDEELEMELDDDRLSPDGDGKLRFPVMSTLESYLDSRAN